MKCKCMLMMMVPGADHALWYNHEQQISGQPPDIIDHKIHNEIYRTKRKHNEGRNPIRGKSEHNHL